jgi:glycosyltransferase involved in cell wall biosynthesis
MQQSMTAMSPAAGAARFTPGLRLGVVGHMFGRHGGMITTQGLILAELFDKAGVKTVATSAKRSKPGRLLDAAATLLRKLPGLDLLMIDTYGGPSFILEDMASSMAKLFGRPSVMVLRGGALPEFLSRYPQWTRRVLSRADLLIAPSTYLSEAFARFGYRVEVIPNVVRMGEYTFRERNQVRPKLLWMRSFHEIYNPMLAIDVLKRVRERYPDAILTMAGQDKGLLAPVQEAAQRFGLRDAVRFPGFLDLPGKRREFANADIFLNTNRIDNMPVAVVEACAAGLPVVATDVGGLKDLITSGETGLIVPESDEALAGAIERLVETPQLAHRLCLKGRALAEACSWEAVAPQWHDAFTRVLAGRG